VRAAGRRTGRVLFVRDADPALKNCNPIKALHFMLHRNIDAISMQHDV
jgi:hypothetical protein